MPSSSLFSLLRRACVSLALAASISGAIFVSLHFAPASPHSILATQAEQQRATQQSNQTERPTSEPYRGDLSIFEYPGRDERLQINRVMDVLRLREGSRVADIGAASGWFTVRAARRVGASGTVYAVEINQDYLRHIEERAVAEGLRNIRAVLGREDDPLLPPRSVDAVLILKTYHEIAQPVAWLRRLRPALRDGALVGIIDRNGSGDDHGVERAVVISEARRAGYQLVEEHDFVKPDEMDYFLVFRPTTQN